MKKQLIILIFVLIVGQVLADGWDTNAWPSYQYPRSGKIHNEDCYSGLVERASAAGVSAPTAPTWYRGQRSELVIYKNWVKDHIGSFVNTNSMVDGVFTNLEWNYGNPIPTLGVGVLVARHSLPNNYFNNTPRRGLCGLGAFTNDTTMGHPYGWMNRYTIYGGTNFPAGRSTWYTTDYGWQGLKDIIPSLVYTKGEASWVRIATNIYAWSKDQADWYPDFPEMYHSVAYLDFAADGWTTSKENVENQWNTAGNWIWADYPYSAPWGAYPGYLAHWELIPTPYAPTSCGIKDGQLISWYLSNRHSANSACRVDLYGFWFSNIGNSFNLPESGIRWETHDLSVGVTNFLSEVYGFPVTLPDTQPNWNYKPQEKLYGERILYKWDVTDGFKYK